MRTVKVLYRLLQILLPPANSPAESLALLISIFGSESICRQNSSSTTCDPYPSVASFASTMNERPAYGRCEGIVVLASRLFNEKRNGLRLGNTSDLTRDQLAQQISYWWGTQILPAVSATRDSSGNLLLQWSGSGAGSLDVIPIAIRTPQATSSFANSK